MTAAIRELANHFQRLTEIFGDVEIRIDKDAKLYAKLVMLQRKEDLDFTALYAGIARLASTASDRQKTSLNEILSSLGVITSSDAQMKCVGKFQSLRLKDMVRDKYGTRILAAAEKYITESERITEP